MTQKLECQRCGEFIDTVLTDKPMITYHEDCWREAIEELREGCIRIGMRIHESKDLNIEGDKYNNYD